MPAEILVFNAGSSSIKVSLFEHDGGEPTLKLHGQIEGLGTPHPRGKATDASGQIVHDEHWPNGDGPKDHAAAMAVIVGLLTRDRPGWKPTGIGHRVVHGGMRFSAPGLIDAECRQFLDELVTLAPLHIPANLKGIDAAATAFPGVPQVACYDTAFHQGRAFEAEAYALPRNYFDEGIRRYGFHGLSYEYVTRAMQRIAPEVARGRMIVAHLGNGASMCAIRNGRSIETTMGFTAVDGLPMGTRCGQLDPGVLLYLQHVRGMTVPQLIELTHKQSGLLGLSGISSDMRDLLASTDANARSAIDYFVYRVTYFVGALTATLGGLDGLVFTGGIGEHAAPIRERVCRSLNWLGIEFDQSAKGPRITTTASKVSAWVVPTDEEGMIARHVIDVLN